MLEENITPIVVASVPLAGGGLAIAMIGFLLWKLQKAPAGSGVQVEISEKIASGAIKFLTVEYLYLIPFVVVMGCFILGVLQGQVRTMRKGEITRGRVVHPNTDRLSSR